MLEDEKASNFVVSWAFAQNVLLADMTFPEQTAYIYDQS